jgi:hypothetical protein
MLQETSRGFANRRGDGDGVPQEKPPVAVTITENLNLRVQLSVALNQAADGRREAGGDPSGSENGDAFYSHNNTLLMSRM